MREPAERHIEVARTARYWTLGPERSAREVWFVLHGYGQLARSFLRRFGTLDDGARLMVAPEALSRFYTDAEPGRHGPGSRVGGTWMTREDRQVEIGDYVAYLDRLTDAVLSPLVPGVRVTVLGFSQGVATAARWCTLGRARPALLLLWGDFLPSDLDLAAAREAWSETEVVLVRGNRDRALASPEREQEEERAIARAGLELRRLRYEGGHDIDPATLAALAG